MNIRFGKPPAHWSERHCPESVTISIFATFLLLSAWNSADYFAWVKLQNGCYGFCNFEKIKNQIVMFSGIVEEAAKVVSLTKDKKICILRLPVPLHES